MRPFRCALTLLLLTADVSAAQVLQVSTVRECSEPCLTVTISQVIHSPAEVGFARDDISRAASTADGDVFIAPRMWDGAILRFKDGSQAGSLGRYGEGPGESRGIMSLAVGVGDSVHAFAPLTRNVLAADASGFRSQRDEFIPIRSNLVFHRGEIHLAMTPRSMTPESAELVLIPRGSGDLDSGETIQTSISPTSVGASLILDSTSRGCLAVGYHGRYRIDVFDSDLTLEATIERSVPWFEAWEDWVPPADEPASTRMDAVMLDCESRLLWVQMTVAEDEGFEPVPEERPLPPLTRRSRVVDTVIEVISLEDLSVVASRRFDGVLGHFLLGGHVLEPFVSETGDQGYRVLKLTLPDTR